MNKKTVIDRLKCLLGFHDYTDGVVTALDSYRYKVERICKRCGKFDVKIVVVV